MELLIWDGNWGLPSVDHHCISVMAYCKFSDVPVKISKINNPWKSPSGELPVLRHESGCETKINDIFTYLRKHNWGTDNDLSAKQSADILAFTALLEERLFPAMLYLWWVDTKTYVEFTRPWYARSLPFPLGWYLPTRWHNNNMARLQLSHGGDTVTDTELENRIMKDAKECLNLLSAKLGENDYFFGKTPTSLDALVFGYLAPLVKAPLPNAALQTHLKSCRNLTQFCTRILTKYFPLSPEEQEAVNKQAEADRQRLNEIAEFPNRRRNIVIAVVMAATVMLAYALYSGLLQIDFIDVEKEEQIKASTTDDDDEMEGNRPDDRED